MNIPYKNNIGSYFLLAIFLFSIACTAGKENEELTTVFKNLSYGKSSSQVVDVVLPDYPSNITKPVDVILFIHGGGWQEGDKEVYADAISDVSKNLQIIAAAMNYRMFGEGAKCNDMLADIHSALSLIKNTASGKGIKINKVILMGASAGAHLSLLYTYKNHTTSPIPIAFCVGQSTPADFTDSNLYTGQEFGNYMLNCVSKLTGKIITIENYKYNSDVLLSISPIHYIKTGIPPTLLAHGKNDIIVPFSNATRLHNALVNASVTTDLFVYSNSGHELDNDTEINNLFYTEMAKYVQAYK